MLTMELMNWLALIVAAFVVVLGILKRLNGWYYAAKLGKIWPKLPPGDMGWPLLGSTISFVKSFSYGQPRNFISNIFIRYGKGDMYKTHILGRATIIVCTAELCRQVLGDEDKFIPSFPISINRLSGRKSLIELYKGEHKRLRRLTTAPITGHAALEIHISHIAQTVISDLEEWASMKNPIELLTEMKKLTFKIVWNIFMGSSSSDYSIGDMVALFTDVAQGFISLPINFPGFNFHKALKARKKLVHILQSMLNQKRLVRKRQGKSWEAKDMMDSLIQAKDEDGEELDDETIVDLIFGKLFGGHETSSYTAMWAVLLLTKHPHIFQKAKEEQEYIVRKRPTNQNGLSLSDVKQMKYLYKVIDETFRVSGITFMLFREALVDVEINGKIIPKGWKIITWFGELFSDEKHFPSPQEFNPSRWDSVVAGFDSTRVEYLVAESAPPKAGARDGEGFFNNSSVFNYVATPGVFLPFGLGTRYCPGSDLAKFEMSIFLHYFLLNYKIEQVNPQCQLTCLPFVHPKDKCLARVHKIE